MPREMRNTSPALYTLLLMETTIFYCPPQGQSTAVRSIVLRAPCGLQGMVLSEQAFSKTALPLLGVVSLPGWVARETERGAGRGSPRPHRDDIEIRSSLVHLTGFCRRAERLVVRDSAECSCPRRVSEPRGSAD